ncbi:viperin family antiviral radical SAM protein [Methanoregula sp.]|uniref:viperin family antiviral radical SAM protein n=1 Tax=Methanoregula sp. TaxID=2052170 RepID=UPI003561698E
MSSAGIIKSVNWHLLSTCNYRCRFCFARNLGETPVSFDKGVEIIQKLVDLGMDKINFAGGEPLLHPRLLDYCRVAKDQGMTVSITTNGSLLNEDLIGKMRGVIDWIALSIDSGSDEIEAQLGRGYGFHVRHCIGIAGLIRNAGIRLKMNTTVTASTYRENMIPLVQTIKPDRWKVLQMLHIHGENDDAVEDLAITSDQFNQFVGNHLHMHLDWGESPVFESSDEIENSYFMITPSGNVKIDTGNIITKFSLDDVISLGVEHVVSPVKYQNRGGIYEWAKLYP